MNIKEQTLEQIDNLIKQYKVEIHKRGIDFDLNSFDTTKLPKVIQSMIKIANAKTSSFSNVSAAAVSNFVLSHLFGQVRPTINDPVYSPDAIGPNTYGIILSRSGCVDCDTEFCTPNGWKKISEFKPEDTVLSWNEDGTTHFDKPLAYVKGPANSLKHYKNNKIDMVLSDDHTMVLYDVKLKKYVRVKSWAFQDFDSLDYLLPSIPKESNVNLTILNSFENLKISNFKSKDGFQYCFTMPNSKWVARRNGKIFVTGNSGKDSTYQALKKTTNLASELILKQQLNELDEKARQKYLRELRKTEPNIDESKINRQDYAYLLEKPETTIASLDSTRGGLTTSLNRMAKSTYGIKSLFVSELGLAIQSNSEITKVLELFSILFDMGQSVAPEFKTQESKEESVEGMFPNLLGISSPAPFYTEGNVRKLLIPMLKTSLARRTCVIFSNAKEEFENLYIPKSVEEELEIEHKSKVILKEYTEQLDQHFLKCIKTALVDSSIMFDEEASELYTIYIKYTQNLAKSLLLRDGDSVEGIEISGRAFKMGRIAAIWALAQNKRVIDLATLKSSIYFVDYTAQHLLRFAETLDLKDYELFINDWKQGFFGNVLPVDQAITKGYISTKQLNKSSLENFLKPVNSKLQGQATVTYNDKLNAFMFVPVEKLSKGDYSYLVDSGHVTTKLSNKAINKPVDIFSKLLNADVTFNPFSEDKTNFIVLNVHNSFLSAELISKYLSKFKHFIAQRSNSFTLVLPINTLISKSEYKYVCLSIANQLMIKLPPEFCEPNINYFGYANSNLLLSKSDELFDISGILSSIASGIDVPILHTKSVKKPSPSAIQKYLNDEILQHKQTIIDMLESSSNPILIFANFVYDLKVHYVFDEDVIKFIESVNSSLTKSISQSDVQTFLVEPFKEL